MTQSVFNIFHTPSGRYFNLTDTTASTASKEKESKEVYLCQAGYVSFDDGNIADESSKHTYAYSSKINAYVEVQKYSNISYSVSDLPDTGKILSKFEMEQFCGALLNTSFLYGSCEVLSNPLLLYTAVQFIPERSKYTLGYSYVTTNHVYWECIGWDQVSDQFIGSQNMPEADSILELFMLVKDKLYFNNGLLSEDLCTLYGMDRNGITALTEFVISEYAIHESKTY